MNRSFVFILLALLCGVGARAVESSQVPFADPYILLDGDTYYAYGTHSDNGIEYYYSTDLVNWRYGGLALSKNNTNETKWFWAPEVYKLNDRYYMYYSANSHLYVAVADSPRGPFIQTGTYILSSLIKDENCIDGTLFQDDNGTLWYYFCRWVDGGEHIFVCQLADDGVTPVEGTMKECLRTSEQWELIWPDVVEGPFVIKHDNKYYLTYSANSYESHDYAVGYATCSKPNGTWKKYSGNPFLRRYAGLYGVGHHSIFTDKEGKLRIVFHAHKSATEIHPRAMYIGTLEWDNDVLKMADEPLISPRSDAPYGGGDDVPSYSPDWNVTYAPSARSGHQYNIRYTKSRPSSTSKWTIPDFNDSRWKEGLGPIGSADAVAPEGSAPIGTVFNSNNDIYNVWFRRKFTLQWSLADKQVFLACGHDDEGEIYIDGTLIVRWGNTWNSGHYFKFTPEQTALLTEGEHVFAVWAKNNAGGYYYDCGLYGISGETPMDVQLVSFDDDFESNAPMHVYDLAGRALSAPAKGVNIMVKGDRAKKVVF